MPRAILIENVPALKEDWRMSDFRTRLHKLGYRTAVDVLDAADFGVPQRRRRMILIGLLDGSAELTLPAGSAPRVHVRSVIANLPPCESMEAPDLHRIRQRLSPDVMERVSEVPKNGGSRRDLTEKHQLACHKDQGGFNDVYGRLKWDEVAPTLTRYCHNPSKGRFLHPEENRGLTLYEAMLLQGFPPDYKFVGNGIGQIASMIGEALPPQLAKAQGEHILSLLRQNS